MAISILGPSLTFPARHSAQAELSFIRTDSNHAVFQVGKAQVSWEYWRGKKVWGKLYFPFCLSFIILITLEDNCSFHISLPCWTIHFTRQWRYLSLHHYDPSTSHLLSGESFYIWAMAWHLINMCTYFTKQHKKVTIFVMKWVCNMYVRHLVPVSTV